MNENYILISKKIVEKEITDDFLDFYEAFDCIDDFLDSFRDLGFDSRHERESLESAIYYFLLGEQKRLMATYEIEEDDDYCEICSFTSGYLSDEFIYNIKKILKENNIEFY